MHCDDKRTLHVLKENIGKSWEELRKSDFDEEKLKKFNDELTEYFELKQSSR